MRSAEEILEKIWLLSNEEPIRSSTGSPLSGYQVDDIITAINEARREAITECARVALLNVYILNLDTGNVKEFNNHLPLSYTKNRMNETVTVDKESILSLLNELT